MWSGRVKGRSCFLLVDGQVTPAAAGVKVERPTGRATLTPARTGAGSGDEKAPDSQSTEWPRKHPFGPPSWEGPHDVGVRAGLLSQLIGRVAGTCGTSSAPGEVTCSAVWSAAWLCWWLSTWMRTWKQRASSLRATATVAMWRPRRAAHWA